jgi:hypothetical protein
MLTTDDKKFLKGYYNFHMKNLQNMKKENLSDECKNCEYAEECRHKNPSLEICMKSI